MSDLLNAWGSQPIPYSQEAEEAVIGSILVNGPAYHTVAAFLKADDFFLLRHQYIRAAMDKIAARNEPIDYLTVMQELRDMDRLGEIGGPAYLTQLINNTPTSVHAETYGRLVERAATRRRLLAVADEIKALALNEAMAVEQVIEETHKRVFDVTEMSSADQVVPFSDLVVDYFDRTEQLINNPSQVIGLPTGFTQLDHLLEGLQKTDLIVLAGRPGMGKSAMLLSIAANILHADAKKRIAFFSLEMSAEQLVQRAVSMESGLNLQALRQPKRLLEFGGWGKFVKTAGDISSYQLFIDDRARLTPRQIYSKVRKLTMGYGPLDLIVVDYIQLMRVPGFKPSERVQEIGHISAFLKNLAKEFDVPVLAAAQLNRNVEQRQDKRPVLSDLRESGSIENDADIVVFMYRDVVYNPDTDMPNLAEAIVAKHRNGPTGTAELYFEKTLTKFMNASVRSVDLSQL